MPPPIIVQSLERGGAQGLPGTADAQPDNPAARGRVQLLFSVGSLDTAALVWKLKGFSDMNVPESIVRPLLPI